MKVDIIHTFEKIYEDESDDIFRFCLVRVSNREQALDITQETFLRLWKSLVQKKEIMNNKAFLFTVAHRLIIDWYRKKKSISLEGMMSKYIEEDMEYNLPDEKTRDVLGSGAEGRFLLDKLNSLTDAHQNPVYLRFVEDLSPAEIGQILGISANAASVRINRGLLELRKETGYYNNEKDRENNGK